MLKLLNSYFTKQWVVPVALLGCILPIQSISVQKHWIHLCVYHNFSGLAVIVLVLLFAIYSFLQVKKQHATHPFTDTLIGGYLASWTIFMTWQTLTLFPSKMMGSGLTLQATAFPREGLALLFIAATGLIYRAMCQPTLFARSQTS